MNDAETQAWLAKRKAEESERRKLKIQRGPLGRCFVVLDTSEPYTLAEVLHFLSKEVPEIKHESIRVEYHGCGTHQVELEWDE